MKHKKTMTVSELKAALSKYPDDMPVWAEWEGCLAHIGVDNFIQGKIGPDDIDVLVINVDDY